MRTDEYCTNDLNAYVATCQGHKAITCAMLKLTIESNAYRFLSEAYEIVLGTRIPCLCTNPPTLYLISLYSF